MAFDCLHLKDMLTRVVAPSQVFIGFGFATNVLVTAMLLTGGSAVASSLTGVPTAAACFLLPIGVVVYSTLQDHESSLENSAWF